MRACDVYIREWQLMDSIHLLEGKFALERDTEPSVWGAALARLLFCSLHKLEFHNFHLIALALFYLYEKKTSGDV